jgi:predicted Zn-dependent peptidase
LVFGGILVVIFDDWGTIETSYYQRINSMSTNTLPSHIHKRLANGLNVILAPLQTKSVTVLAMVGTGSRFETAKTSGISHFLEHMVFKGTAKYPTPMAIAEAVDSIGAEQNAFTSKEYTGYYITSAAKHLGLTLDIQSQMLTAPLLPQDDLNREREVIVEEINMYEDQPMAMASELFENLMYDGQYGKTNHRK